MGPAMQAEIPGIANTCRTSEGTTSYLFSQGDKSVFSAGKYADPSIFSMFTLPFVQGNASSAFSQLHNLVITQKTAIKFFGTEDNVIGKTIRVDNKQDYVVSGVLKDIPTNTTLQFEWLMPFQVYFNEHPNITDWGFQTIKTYAELRPGVKVANINKQLYGYIQKREPDALGRVFLFGMNDWHLRDDFKDGHQTGGGQIEYVHLFTLIAWIILLIACINFMNLATSQSEKRAREVGVRKVLGAGKKMLIMQFIGEAVFTAFISAIIALALVALILPSFNTIVQKQLSLGLANPMHLLGLVAIALVCGLVAGSYPSFYLSSFNPVTVLKGTKLKNSGAAFIRKGLVVMQFTISIVLIVSTVIVYQQIQHVKSRQLGFDKDKLLEMDAQGDIGANFNSIKQDLLNTGYIANAALADHSILRGGNNNSGLTWDAKPAGTKVLVSKRYVTTEFMETSGLKILEGRNITIADTGIINKVVITQSMAKLMGSGSPIGKTIRNNDNTGQKVVVGIVNDYVYGDMYGKPAPVIFMALPPRGASVMYMKIKPGDNMEAAITAIQSVLKKGNPAYPFDYRFVDEQFNQMFMSEMLVSKLSRVFASLAIIISCLGLFGLAAYTAERRTREIGIRKVLGASVSGVTALLSKDFLQLVLLSCLLAFPIAYWQMHNWLKAYEYRINIQLWVFVAAGMAAMLIAMITVSFQAIKAALANPVKSLRSE
jgi:predicted permease